MNERNVAHNRENKFLLLELSLSLVEVEIGKVFGLHEMVLKEKENFLLMEFCGCLPDALSIYEKT